MRIKVTEERECCQRNDLKPVHGAPKTQGMRDVDVMFCIHCGRRHQLESFMDAAGSRDYEYRPVRESWEIGKPTLAELGAA